MASAALTREERWGLAISIAGHAALLAVLLMRPSTEAIVTPPERVEVTISEDFGMTSSSPNPAAEAAPDEGPEIGEAAPPPPAAEPAPLPPDPAPRVIEPPRPPAPRPVARPEPPKPQPKPVAREAPRAEPRKPVVREVVKPAPPKPAPSKAVRPAPPRTNAVDRVATRALANASSSSRPAPRSTSAAATPAKGTTPPAKAGASRFAEAFGPGTPGAAGSTTTGAPAATIGPQQISALNAAIGRQLKPHWRGKAPEGAEAELLATRVRFRLNRDGSLAGEPQVLATTGQTEANQPQVARHQEQAVRAVKLAAPFDLPEPLYDGWKVVTTNFDRKLSQ
jgi:outer membrane biosynthesis protein TonB